MPAKKKGKAAVEALDLRILEPVYVPIDSLRPNPWNPNRQEPGDFDLLLASMTTDGFTQPVIALADGTIVDGEHRWRAAAKLEMTEIPVVYVDLTIEEAKIATLRHNRARGSEDLELAADVLRDLEKLGALDWAQSELGLSDFEVQRVMADLTAAEALAGEEFSRAWEPISITAVEYGGSVDAEDIKGAWTTRKAVTEKAQEVEQLRRVRMDQAPSPEARFQVQEEEGRRLYRYSVILYGDDADLAREVLGEQPAEKLVEVLRTLEIEPMEAVG